MTVTRIPMWTAPPRISIPPIARVSRDPASGQSIPLRAARVASWLAAIAIATVAAPSFAGKVSVVAPEASTPCDRCNVQMAFATKMKDLGVEVEFVELKNGLGVFYTTADARLVPKVQSVNEWARGELVRVSTQSLDHLHLCQYCKAARPIYSKIDREVVRVERGAFFLMRSEDPEAVRALHELRRMAEAPGRTSQKGSPAPSR